MPVSLNKIYKNIQEGHLEDKLLNISNYAEFKSALDTAAEGDQEIIQKMIAKFKEARKERSISGGLIDFANSLSRIDRNNKFREKKRNNNYKGPIIISEGDSWFQYPLVLQDIIDNLSKTYAIKSFGAAGDELANMISEEEYLKGIKDENPDIFLFSGSGNDVLGSDANGNSNFAKLIKPYSTNMPVDQIINRDNLRVQLDNIKSGYNQVIEKSLSASKNDLNILIHGYDYPIPIEDGQWIGPNLIKKGVVDPVIQKNVIKILLDELNSALSEIADSKPNVHYVDCRNAVSQNSKSSRREWYNEIHPRKAGFKRAADRFDAMIKAII